METGFSRPRQNPAFLWTLAGLVAAAFAWSWIGARDRPTWWLEALPAIVAVPVVVGSGRRFPLTPLVYTLIAIHAAILLVGAHYTYEHVPPFDWLKERLHLKRNDYDRLGHLAQGFVPAIVAREILIRQRIVNGTAWRTFLIVCVCMAISACYELAEWSAAAALGGGADKFLATQGDPFDTQKDMLCALIGAIAALVVLGRWHDRQLRELAPPL